MGRRPTRGCRDAFGAAEPPAVRRVPVLSSLLAFFLLAVQPSLAELPAFATAFRFEQFQVVAEQIGKPASPRLSTPAARRYATQLRQAAQAGLNFSGYMRVAEWRCGTCCTEFALINLHSGAVWFPGFTVACSSPLTDPIGGSAALYYRADSSLFVVIGAPNEGPERGVYFYRWNGKRLVSLGSQHIVKVP